MKEFLKREITVVRPVWRVILNALMAGFIIAVVIFVALNTPQFAEMISSTIGTEWAFRVSIILLPIILAIALLLSTGYVMVHDDEKKK